MTQLTLTAIYDSFLLLFDAENSQKVSCLCKGYTSNVKDDALKQ